MEPEKPSKKSSRPKKANSLVRYSGLATQMIAIILLGVYLGSKLDEHFGTEKPYWSGGLAFVGVIVGLYVSLKNLIRK